jgi:hypothetical protein
MVDPGDCGEDGRSTCVDPADPGASWVAGVWVGGGNWKVDAGGTWVWAGNCKVGGGICTGAANVVGGSMQQDVTLNPAQLTHVTKDLTAVRARPGRWSGLRVFPSS